MLTQFVSQIQLAKPALVGAKQKPTWQEMARLGTYRGYHGGSFDLTLESFEQMINNFHDGSASNQVPVYIGHPDRETEAVGWILDIRRDGETLLGLIEFTPRMIAKIKAGAFKYLSIEADLEATHPNTGEPIGARLTSLAVTNQPFIRGLKPLSLSASEANKGGKVYGSGNHTQRVYLQSEITEGEMPLEEIKSELMGLLETADEATLMKLLEMLKGASEEESAEGEAGEVEASTVKAQEDQPLLDALREALGLPELTLDEALAWIAENAKPAEESAEEPAVEASNKIAASDFQAMKLALSEYKTKLRKVETELNGYRKAAIESVVDAKIADGTIHASKRETYIRLAEKDPDTFRDLTGTDSRKVVQLGALVKASAEDTKHTQPELTEYGKKLSAELNRRLGIKKTN